MGSAFSSNSQLAEADTLPITEHRKPPYYGLPVPAEASTAPQDSQGFYTDFFEEASYPPGWPPDSRLLEGWPVIKIRKVYERLNEDHPRVVRYVGELENGSLVIERLWPGPLHHLTLPAMTVPIPETPSRNDRVMLSLYYRWALQALSAISLFHSRSVFLRIFSSQLVWLRSDYSLAMTGFISADVTGDKTDYKEGGWVGDEWMPYDDSAAYGSVNEDLFYWATFVWRLVTNDFTDQSPSDDMQHWEPVVSMEGGVSFKNPDANSILCNRLEQNLFQQLEQARLGSVLLKAWNGKYESADEVAEEIRSIASSMGITVNGDEVELEESWDDIFEVVQMGRLPRDRSIRFKPSE